MDAEKEPGSTGSHSAGLTRSGNSGEDSGSATPKKPKIHYTFQVRFLVFFFMLFLRKRNVQLPRVCCGFHLK